MARVCSTDGECVCSAVTREVAGECRLVEGERCQEDRACASGHCADGICCDEACDGLCERCDARGSLGKCAEDGLDEACIGRAEFQCMARDRCRLPLGATCGPDADCDSEHCELDANAKPICCAEECSGLCQRCDADGACNDHPATDVDCGVVTCDAPTACVSYRTPAPRACAGSGVCAACEPVYTRAGVPCEVGGQCDGAGECRQTGLGRLAAGSTHTCAIRDDGNVVCWGSNEFGQLGAAFTRAQVGDDEAPASVADLVVDFDDDVVQIVAAHSHTCALLVTGAVRCWGEGDASRFSAGTGLLGTSVVELHPSGFVNPLRTGPVQLPGLAVQISAANGAHTCALLDTGQVVCWGWNRWGQCGNDTRVDVGVVSNETLPIVPLPARALQVRASLGHTCALLEGGLVTCWGIGTAGRLGYGVTTDRLAPLFPPNAYVEIGEPALDLELGLAQTCVLLAGGRVRCWGGNRDGALGYGHEQDIGDDETPAEATTLPRPPGDTYNGSGTLGGNVQVGGGGGGVVQIAPVADSNSICVRFVGGNVRCWGDNRTGELGYGHASTFGNERNPDELLLYPPAQAGDLQLDGSAFVLAAGARCALRTDGALYCWGRHEHGQLGLPERLPNDSRTMTPVELGPVSWR